MTRFHSSLRFDGVADTVSSGYDPGTQAEGAVECVFRGAHFESSQGIIWSKASAYRPALYLQNGRMRFGLDSNYADTPSGFLDVGRWYHSLCTWGPAGMHIYLDGKLVAYDSYGGTHVSSGFNFGFGANWAGFPFEGDIAKVRWFTSQPTDAQARKLWSADEKFATPALEYLFDDGDGTTLTNTGSAGGNGTVTGAEWDDDTPQGIPTLVRPRGHSLKFDGVSGDVVDVPYSASMNSDNNATLEVWARFHEGMPLDGSGVSDPLVWMDLVAPGYLRITRLDGTWRPGFIQFVARDSGGDFYCYSRTRVPVGEWMHLVMVTTATTIKAYINGKLVDSVVATYAGTFTQDSGTSIGTSTVDDHGGDIGRAIRYWKNRALSDDEVQDLYRGGRAPYRSDIALELLFTDAAGTTLTDSSGNGNDGTISGATWTTETP